MISLIVAHDENRVIGYDNQMPWHLPGDLHYFKEMTMGKPVLMGRKTFESIGKALPGRRNIVITRNPAYQANDIEIVSSLQQGLQLVQDAPEKMVIGGEQIFKQALPLAERLYITAIANAFRGDTYFPPYPDWRLVRQSEPHTSTEGYTFTYCIYEKS